MSLRTRLVLLQTVILAAALAILGGLLVGSLPDDVDDSLKSRELWLLLAGGTAVLVSAVLATLAVVGRALRPLGRIADTAERIAATGDVDVQVEVPAAGGEIGRLGRSFDRMVDRLRRLLVAQRQLLADTSHELRNPLTVIRTNLDLLRHELDPQTREEVARETEEEAARMSRLVADLLLLGRQEESAAGDLVPVQLDRLARDVVERFRQLSPDHTILLGQTDLMVARGDPDRLRQVLANLVDNAVRHTAPDGGITVSVERVGSEAQLIVADTGAGIEPRHLPRIFDRFYRADPARGRATGGSGLGLTIVKHVVEAHGGRVSAESEVGRGSRFVVTLPAEPSWAGDVEGDRLLAQTPTAPTSGR